MKNDNEKPVAWAPVELNDASWLTAFCPNPKMPMWSAHPRVYLTFDEHGYAQCPYCSTEYQLAPGIKFHGGHAGGHHH